MYNNLYKYKSVLILIIKLLIISGAFYYISNRIINNNALNNSDFLTFLQLNVLNDYSVILTIVLFSIINWSLEIVKWKILVSSITDISLYKSLEQSLSSLTASLLTPNRIGEYGAKAIYYPKYKRSKIILLTFLGNFSQMSITVFFGIFGLIFLINLPHFFINKFIFQSIVLIIFIGFISIILFKKYLNSYWQKFIFSINDIPINIHFRNFLFSFLRYLIFSHQFYFIIMVFGGEIDYLSAMPIIFSMYFIASIIPGFVIFDWLIKGSVAVSLFSVLGVNELIIVSTTSLMWLLNFAFPSIIGSYFVLSFSSSFSSLKENRIQI